MDVKYIKSFSKGQITIPKDLRKALGMVDEFWLKLYLQDGKIIAEPMEDNNKENYKKTLLSIKSTIDLEPEISANRAQMEKRFKKLAI